MMALVAALVLAQPPSEETIEAARSAFAKAEAAYREGRFERALEGYRAAYALVPRPALLFNAGQAQRNLGQLREAIVSFELYLQEADDPADRAEVIALTRQLEAKLDARGDDGLFDQWWFWTLAGGLVVGGSAAAIAVAASGSSDPPTGTLGTFDYR